MEAVKVAISSKADRLTIYSLSTYLTRGFTMNYGSKWKKNVNLWKKLKQLAGDFKGEIISTAMCDDNIQTSTFQFNAHKMMAIAKTCVRETHQTTNIQDPNLLVSNGIGDRTNITRASRSFKKIHESNINVPIKLGISSQILDVHGQLENTEEVAAKKKFNMGFNQTAGQGQYSEIRQHQNPIIPDNHQHKTPVHRVKNGKERSGSSMKHFPIATDKSTITTDTLPGTSDGGVGLINSNGRRVKAEFIRIPATNRLSRDQQQSGVPIEIVVQSENGASCDTNNPNQLEGRTS